MLQTLRTNPFPAYHNQPLALTIKEISNPQEAIENFFETWSLTQVRYIMKEWLYEAYNSELGIQKEFLFLHDDLLRLVETAWLIHQHNNEHPVEK